MYGVFSSAEALPESFHFFVRHELTAARLAQTFLDRSSRLIIERLNEPFKVREDERCECILIIFRKRTQLFDRLIKELRHRPFISQNYFS